MITLFGFNFLRKPKTGHERNSMQKAAIEKNNEVIAAQLA
ncbi:GntR family transcriptional regulator, partial [Mesorhizobium sp. M7A.F.Ca.CA.002.09.1.1]